MTTIKTNSNMLPSDWQPDTYSTYDIDSYLYDEENDTDTDVDVDHKKWVTCVSNKILEYMIDEASDDLARFGIVVSPKVLGVFSPKEYNYSTDGFEFEITVDERMMIDVTLNQVDNKIGSFPQYLDYNYSSSDGFISHMPSSVMARIGEDDLERKVMCVMGYVLSDIKSPRYNIELCQDAYDCIIYPS